jgi:hypothetical protein
MSGLLLRSHMNAGQDGFRDMGPNRSSTSTATVRNGVSYISDRSITPSVCKFTHQINALATDHQAGASCLIAIAQFGPKMEKRDAQG